jgi:hypothetical protein
MSLQWEDTSTGGGCTALIAYRRVMYVITCPDDPSTPEPGEAAYLGIYPHHDTWGQGESLHEQEFPSTEAAQAFAEAYVVPAAVPGSVDEALRQCTLDPAPFLASDVLAVPADTVVGQMCVTWWVSFSSMLDSFTPYGMALENSTVITMAQAIARNCDIALRG